MALPFKIAFSLFVVVREPPEDFFSPSESQQILRQ